MLSIARAFKFTKYTFDLLAIDVLDCDEVLQTSKVHGGSWLFSSALEQNEPAVRLGIQKFGLYQDLDQRC